MSLQWIVRFCFIIFFQTLCVSCEKNSSLTFVIDDTLSMTDDIEQVQQAAGEIMDIITREKGREIKNVILVTFNDPEVVLREKTSSKRVLLNALDDIVVHNRENPDCPEYALTGIEKALQESGQGSYLYVFTDASAKDHAKLNAVKTLCEKKQSQVIFVLTGDCVGYVGEEIGSLQVYYDIAKATNGLVFNVNKNDVKDVVETFKESLKGQRSVLTSMIVPAREYYTPVRFAVDDKTEFITISSSGRNVDIAVTDKAVKGGRIIDTEKLLWKSSAKIVKFYSPAPGTYYAWVKGDTDVTIVVYARTDFTFEHGFSEFVPNSMADTSKLPTADQKHHLSISVTDPKHTVDIKTAEILDMNERVIVQLPLRKASGDLYITDAFISPSTMFKIQVTGTVKRTGQDIKRISTTAIEPHIPPPPVHKTPVITITEGSKIEVDYNGEISLTCKVSGYPTPRIWWAAADGTILSEQSHVVELPYDYISYLKLTNVKKTDKYYCKAYNAEAQEIKQIVVNPRSPFWTRSPSGTTRTKYGEEKKLQCPIFSSFPMDIIWNTPLKPSEYTLSADKKILTINSVGLPAQGRYTCKATLKSDANQKHVIHTDVVISDLAPPTITPTADTMTVSYESNVHIWCKISGGVPPPIINWEVMKNEDGVYRKLSATGEELTITRAKLAEAGRYRCIAQNQIGKENKITRLIVQTPPMVGIDEGSKKSIAYGSSQTLTCKIIAHPPPKIEWRDSRGNKLTSQETKNNNVVISRLNLQNVQASGSYSCFAQNTLGQTASNIDLLVSSPFVVQTHPGNEITSKFGAKTDITCDIKSSFPLKIRWFFKNNSGSSEIHTSDKYKISATGTTLSILFTNLDTIGTYTCEAKLANDEKQKVAFTTNVHINDLSVPVLQTTDPAVITVKDKDKVKIPCKIVGGVPPPVVRWQFKSKRDDIFRDLSASGEELTVDSAVLASAGQYRCIATNAQGQAKKTTGLIVQKAPEASITEGATVTVPYGSINEFECRIVAFPFAKITWRDSKGNVLHATNIIHNNEVTSRLEVQHIKASNTYSCFAENDLGKAVTSVQVSVSSPFNFISHPPETTSIKYRSPALISCDVMSSFPIKMRWFYQKNEHSPRSEIHASDKYTITPDERSLRIKSTDLDLVGKYTCEASLVNDENEKKSFTTKVELNNLKAPEIVFANQTVTVMNGQRMSAFCQADGVPKPVVTWQFRSKSSDVYTNMPDKGEQITNPKISYALAGSYKCTATSELGVQSRTIDVVVHGKPNISNVDSKFYGVTGDKVLKIPCNVTGVPEPTVTWKNGDKLVSSDAKISIDKNNLFIKNPTEKDSNSFTCEAKNIFGKDTKNFEAVISDSIYFDETFNKYIYLKQGQSADIKCHLPHSDPRSIRWYVNYGKPENLGVLYSLKNAQFSNDGNYTCRTNNEDGSESLNFVVDVGYEPNFMATPSMPILWRGNKEDLLDCNVRAKPRAKVEWFYFEKPLKETQPELAISGWGEYTCKVKNVHGTVQRTFNVTSDACIIDRTTSTVQNTPLLLGEEQTTWPQIATENEFYTLSRNEMITLECATEDQPVNTFKTHPNAKEIKAECYNEDKFKVDGKIYKFNDLQCAEYVKPSYVLTQKPCLTNGEIVDVGFKLNKGFLSVYEVCYSGTDRKALYSKVVMSIVNIENRVAPSFQLHQGNHDSKPKQSRYNTRWLVSSADVAFGPAQTATLSEKYNTILVYEPSEDSSRWRWSDVEKSVQYALYDSDQVTVWTGASQYDSQGISRYLWKVVKFDDDMFETIVYVNAANPSSSDILCPETISERLGDAAKDQYTYFCSEEDFAKAFNIKLSDLELD